jgi:vacuolar-type H+-ATPase subunit H
MSTDRFIAENEAGLIIQSAQAKADRIIKEAYERANLISEATKLEAPKAG